jgi:hypothetical protein
VCVRKWRYSQPDDHHKRTQAAIIFVPAGQNRPRSPSPSNGETTIKPDDQIPLIGGTVVAGGERWCLGGVAYVASS